ncbi:hypothetical protein [Meiothermus sp.]|jgi:hypothetical protein|uniref:hypothetical protein n=1 Tax=Meiothermus sp. TaxID=1955249 RepID=UPI00307DE83E
MDVNHTLLIDVLIEVLQRLKQESPEFQEDALWKIGDYIAQAIEEGQRLEADRLLEELWEFHQAVQAMAETEG